MLSRGAGETAAGLLSDRGRRLRGVSSSPPVWTRVSSGQPGLESIGCSLLGLPLVFTHAFSPTKAQSIPSPFPVNKHSRTPSLTRHISGHIPEQEEATQGHGRSYVKPVLPVLLLFLDQKPQLRTAHQEHSKFPGSRVKTVPAERCAQPHCAVVLLCLGRAGNALLAPMGLGLGTVNKLQLR